MRTLMLVAVVVSGCGPLDGYNCEKLDERSCDGSTKVAFCEATSLGGKKWKAYSCPSGCNGAGTCDWRGVVEGDPCPALRAQPPCVADGEAISCGTGVWQRSSCPLCKKDKTLAESGAPCSNGLCSCN